jgi:hypothetical protein
LYNRRRGVRWLGGYYSKKDIFWWKYIYFKKEKKGVNELNKMFPLISPPNTHIPQKALHYMYFFFCSVRFCGGGVGIYEIYVFTVLTWCQTHKHVLQQHIFFFLKTKQKKNNNNKILKWTTIFGMRPSSFVGQK